MSSGIDLSNLSDEELEHISRTGTRPTPTQPMPVADVSNMSDAELEYMSKTGKRLPAYESGEGMARGFLQGGYAEHADELAGGLQAGAETLIAPATGDQRGIVGRYTDARDELRAKNARAREVDPAGYYGAEIVGGIVSPFTRARGGPIAQGLKLGGVTGFGASDADLTTLTPDAFGSAALATGVGAGAGATAAKVIPAIASRAGPALVSAAEGAANALRKVPGAPAVERFARAGGEVVGDFGAAIGGGIRRSLERNLSRTGREGNAYAQAAKAAGLQGIADTNRIGGLGAVDDVGKFLLDSGLVNPRRLDRESIQEAAELMLKQRGEQIGQIRVAMREAGIGPETADLTVGIEQLQGRLAPYAELPQVKSLLEIGEQVKRALEQNTDRYGRTQPEILDEIKVLLDDELFKLGDTGNLAGRLSQPAQQMRGEIRELFRQSEEAVADQLHPTIGQQFRQAKSDYGNLKDVLYLGGRGDRRDLSNKAISLTDWQILGPAASQGPDGLFAGAAAWTAKQIGERFGNAALANTLVSPKMDRALGLAQGAAQGAQQMGGAAWQSLLDKGQKDGVRGLVAAAGLAVQLYPNEVERIRQEVRRRQGGGASPLP